MYKTQHHSCARYTLLFVVAAFLIVSALYSCEKKEVAESEAQVIERLNGIMSTQQQAWNKGDIEGFMQPYWKSDSLAFVGKTGITRGWQATLDRYRKNYSTAEEMGRLVFKNLEWKTIDEAHVYTIGQWTLYRVADTLSGHYSLLWEKQKEKWCIVADHSS